jgi:hypothetical protein
MAPVKSIKEEKMIELQEDVLDIYDSDSSIECVNVVKILPQKRIKQTVYKTEE